MKPAAVPFDVNETLLDMSALDPLFADAFGDKGVRRTWFAQTIANVLAATLLGTYADFGEMQRAALEMTARRRGIAIDPERVRRILRGVAALPAHGDAIAGLTRLREDGMRLAILTNATREMVEAQLDAARLRPFFDDVFSADDVRRFKPAREPYAMASERMREAPRDLMFVAAHDWDVTGAMKAGYRTAFIARHGSTLNPLEAPPEISVPDIRALAEQIVASGVPA
jgi:2-haloacid dehalogenase